MKVDNGNESNNIKKNLKNKVIQREEFDVKESQHYGSLELKDYNVDFLLY